MAFPIGRPIPAIILDEIGLEGLDGITISGLWIRLSDTLQVPLPLLDHFQIQVWNVVLQARNYLEFYELPAPREKLKVWKRFDCTDPEYGLPLALEECPFTLYKFIPISDGEVMGSCECYKERKPIDIDEIQKMTLKEVEEKWGDTFVIVGNQKLRYNCLVPPNMKLPCDMTLIHFCVLEFIGRARQNGVASAGNFSVLHCCKDSAIAFYVKNKLVKLGLITIQPYTEKRSERLVSSSLLTLTRFHSQNKTVFVVIIEKIFFGLKNSINQQMPLIKLKNLFPQENQSMVKKILMTHIFRKFFETKSIRVKDIPEANRMPKMHPEREVICVKLKNPNLTVEELFNDQEEPLEKDTNDFYDYKHTFVDMPLKEELHRAIEKHGSVGVSQSQLCSILSMSNLNVRQLLKKATMDKAITSYCKDMGRQRTNMIVAANCSTSVKRAKEEHVNIAKNLKCNDEPKFPPEEDPPLKDIPEITSNIKDLALTVKECNNGRDETSKQVERKRKIVQFINDRCLMQVPTIRQEIIRSEVKAGYKDEICNKSLFRTMARLKKSGIVNLYEISLKYNEHARIYRYVAHPKIDKDHRVVHQEILKLKNTLFLYLEEKKFRTTPGKVGQSHKPKVAPVGLIPPGPQKSPKFLTARFLHEFMFYAQFEMEHDQQPVSLTRELLSNWLQAEPHVNVDELHASMIENHITPYNAELNWKTFISPMPFYEGKPHGWISLPDLVERMPLSFLKMIIHVPPEVDPAAAHYIAHPVRQHYLIKQLPLTIQSLINRSRLGRILVNIVRILQRMGLIQVSERRCKEPLQLWIYINRRANILDTTSSDLGYLKISADREYPEIRYNFGSYADVVQYWNCLHKICIHTKLGFVHKNAKKNTSKIIYRLRRNELNFIVAPVKEFEDAPALDTGKPPGDGLGAGGIASGLYSSFHRNWTWLVNTKYNAAAAAQKLKKTTKYVRTKLSKLITPTGFKKPVGTPTALTVKKVNRFGGRVLKRKGTIVQAKPKVRFPTDPVDRDALKQMRSLRAKWSAREDQILKMARATFLFLVVPVLHFSRRDVAKITRDIIRIQCGIYNKTTQACHRRIHFLVKTNRHLPELPTWLHAMQTDEYLTKQYEGDKFFNDLKRIYPNKSDFRNALFVHFLHVFKHLQEQLSITEPKDRKYKASYFPDTVEEFHMRYRECSPLNESKTLLHLNPTNLLELQLATVINVLHSSLCCVRDKTQYNLQIFEILKMYSEDILHAAFKKARLDGLVVARKKNQIKTYTTQLAGPSYVFSNRFRLSLMFLRIPFSIFDMFYAFFDQAIRSIFSPESTTIQLKSPHTAQLFFMGEFLYNDCIEVNIKAPSSILTIDPTAQQSSITESERIMDHYHHLLDNGPETEYTKQFDALGELATRVKFKAANEKYKLNYHPFDVVSHLNGIQIHFFCFLGNLKHAVNLTFSLYKEEPENFCPFNDCVMRSGNYLNAIDKIITSKRDVLDKILENVQMDTDAGENEYITLTAANLMGTFEKFQVFLSAQLKSIEQRDLGKISMKRQRLDFISLSKDIAEGCDDDVLNSDEYEPTLNKEERIAKAQDVFVVNLPTLQITATERALENSNKAKYKEVMVAEHIMEPALQRDDLIAKVLHDSSWTYTQNTLQTLQPTMDACGLSEDEQMQVGQILDFIESHDLGVPAADLLARFPDIEFLQKAMKLLREHYLVLRAGVSSFMYVHKNHTRHWLIHARHIKRLERESLGKLMPSTEAAAQKRPLEVTDCEESESVARHSKSQKRPLIAEGNDCEEFESVTKHIKSETGKRIPKPVERLEYREEVTTSTLPSQNDPKELLILKPCPWIRVNGSLNRRVLDKWLASIVIECTVQSGCTVHSICLRFKLMQSTDIMYLLELLIELKIIELRCYKRPPAGLFSQLKPLQITSGNEFTDPRNTFIIPAPDAITRLSVFIGEKLYKTEFI